MLSSVRVALADPRVIAMSPVLEMLIEFFRGTRVTVFVPVPSPDKVTTVPAGLCARVILLVDLDKM